MHHTYHSHRHVAALEGTITWAHFQPTREKLQTFWHQKIAQSTQNVHSSKTWWCLWPKQKSGDCYTMGKQLYPYASHSMNSDLPNYQPHSKQTTTRSKALSPLQLDKKVQGNEHAILLDEGKDKTKRHFRLLETGKLKHHQPHHHREICAMYLYMENVLFKIDHKIVHEWCNDALTPIHMITITPIHMVAIPPNRTVVKRCANVVRIYGHTNTTKVT